ncbi:gibberellin-regulated protein 14-like isoform X2 [Mangifera indica]|uniref:gibberellin-regulated protein 14-like isoform X2 n=1 Tax=Mangifera indica TaxID=29780 RepID=UPI001CF9C4AD|nr:gibberellin-regulated protein 14-like isoform X2 [Mangifera indica]
MTFTPLLLLLATFVLVSTRVSSCNKEELFLGKAPSATPPPPVSPPKATPPPPVSPPKATPPPSPVSPPKSTPPPAVSPPTSKPSPPISPPKATPPSPVSPPKTTPPPAVNPPKNTPPPPVSPPKTTPPTMSPPPPPVRTKKDCLPLCGQRCKLHSRKNLCVRACVTCCDRCKCVPPGTYGNKELCGKCYTDMTTRNNKPKCP